MPGTINMFGGGAGFLSEADKARLEQKKAQGKSASSTDFQPGMTTEAAAQGNDRYGNTIDNSVSPLTSFATSQIKGLGGKAVDNATSNLFNGSSGALSGANAGANAMSSQVGANMAAAVAPQAAGAAAGGGGLLGGLLGGGGGAGMMGALGPLALIYMLKKMRK